MLLLPPGWMLPCSPTDSLGLSNMSVTVSPSSAAFMVTTSSLPAHFRILAKLFRLRPAASAMTAQQQV